MRQKITSAAGRVVRAMSGRTCSCGHDEGSHFAQVGSCNRCGCGAFRG